MRILTLALAAVLGCGGSQPHAAEEPDRGHGHGHAQHEGADRGPSSADGHHKQHKMPAHFRGAKEWAKRFDHPERDGWQKPAAVIEAMKIETGMTVADIGAGTGYFEPHLSKAVGTEGKVLAHDLEADMVRYLQERSKREGWKNVEAKVVGPDSPGLEGKTVDRVLVVNTWHHIGSREAYAKKVAAALGPGGALVIVDFHLRSTKGPPKKHKLAPSVVAAELVSAGLKVQTLLGTLPEQYIVLGWKQ